MYKRDVSRTALRIDMAPAGYEPLKNDPELDGSLELSTAPRPSRSRKFFLTTLAILGVVGISAFYALSGPSNARYAAEYAAASVGDDGPEHLQKCPSGLPPPARPPAPSNPFASLTVPETTAIHAWVSDPARALNLTAGNKAWISDNFIYRIEAHRPAKRDAVAFLDRPDAAPAPPRYAHVVVHHGAAPEPYVQDYLVGPLPLGPATTMRPLKEVYHIDPIPYNARGFGSYNELAPLLLKVMPELSEATEVSRRLPARTIVPACSYVSDYRSCLAESCVASPTTRWSAARSRRSASTAPSAAVGLTGARTSRARGCTL